MVDPILVTGAAGRVGAVGRTVTELLLKQGKAVRAMVRNEDQRAQALRDRGAEVVVGDLLDLDSMHRVIAGCETMYFGMSVSDAYLAATVNAAAVAKHHGVRSGPTAPQTRPRCGPTCSLWTPRGRGTSATTRTPRSTIPISGPTNTRS